MNGECPPINNKPEAIPHVDYPGCRAPDLLLRADGPARPERHPAESDEPASRSSPATSPASTPSSSTPTARSPGWTCCTSITRSGSSTGIPSSPSVRRKRSFSRRGGSAGEAGRRTSGTSTTCSTTSSGRRPGRHRLEDRLRPGHLARRGQHADPDQVDGGRRAEPRVGISSQIYPVFDALKGWGTNGKYTFPDQATGGAAPARSVAQPDLDPDDHPVTLIETAGHLHPGRPQHHFKVRRGDQRNTLFTPRPTTTSPRGRSHGTSLWGPRPGSWRVKVPGGRQVKRPRDL